MKNSLQRWLSGRAGSVSLASGFVFVLMAVGVGGAVDFSNAVNRRADLQRSADAAALAGAARQEMEINDIQELALSGVDTSALIGQPSALVTRSEDGIVSVTIDANSATSLLSIAGWHGVDIQAVSSAAFVPAGNGKIEVALVLDTTQSMADDMDALRASAQELATKLFDVGGENVKISVVPYVASVNVGNGVAQMAWMDTTGQSTYHGYSQRGWDITRCKPTGPPVVNTDDDDDSGPSCWGACGCPGTPACGGGDDGASLDDGSALKYAGGMLQELLGATAVTAGSLPYPTPDPNSCPLKNPPEINYFDIYDALPNTEWMGCVEARPAPYDVTDAAPDADGNLTRFVPYFWPDEADWYGDDASIAWENDYVDDAAAGPVFDDTIAEFPTWSGRRRVNVYKYNDVASADLDIEETGADRKGPNRACPDPMLPLTNNAGAVSSKISGLTHRNGGGTIISEGVMWGWRALSPGAPFTEGVDYDDETRKIVIVMSDGANSVIARNTGSGPSQDETLGDYTAYGFAEEFDQDWPSRGLMDTSSDTSTPYFDQIRAALDERTAQACANVKAAGTEDNPVELYTVLVGDSDEQTEEVMASCATTRNKHYKSVTQISALTEAFDEIAQNIGGQGSSRLVH